MTIDKKINYEIQGGAKNYLGKQKQVQAPIKWKSSPDSPETELAYITKAEKDLLVKKDLHGSLNGDVNRGPSGIMSLDGYGSFDGPDPSKDTGMSGAATSDAETGKNTANTRAEGPGRNLPPGVTDQGLQGYRDAFINAGGGQRVNAGFFDSRNTISPAELSKARVARNNPNNRFGSGAYRNTRGGFGNFISGGGITGNLIRKLGQKFGFGKTYDEPTYDMSEFNNLGLDGINPATLDFDPNARISNTSFTQEPTELRPETQMFNFNNSKFTSDIAPQFQGQAINIGINEAQKSLIDQAINNAKLSDTKIPAGIYDQAKELDTEAESGFLGYGKKEADPMTEQEYKNYLVSQGYI
tara:strand:- start:52 stop:1116 length:1065 start_codon:yes stop_codon:yes gene_type:complete